MKGRHRRDELTAEIERLAERACKRAIGYTRAGRPGRAEYELVRTGIRIAHLVEDRTSAESLSELRLFEPFHNPRLGDLGGVA